MIAARAKVKFDGQKVRRKADDGTFRSLGHAAGAIRLTARRSIRQRKSRIASPVGTPPFTHTGRLKKSILFFVEKQKKSAIIGSAADIIGRAGSPHEHGGRFRGDTYKPRPFMRPALLKLRSRLPAFWRDSIR